MRIAYFTDTPRIGGAERFLAGVVEAASKAEHEVTLISPSDEVLDFLGAHAPGATRRRAGSAEYLAEGITRATRVRHVASSFTPLVRGLRAARPEILHVNNGGFPGSELCRLATVAGATARVPQRIMSVNSMPFPREEWLPRTNIAADAVTWRACHTVTVPARIVGDELMRLRGLPCEKLKLLHYGVTEPSGVGAAEVRRSLAPEGTFLIGMVTATASPAKGFDVLLDALARIPEHIRCVIVGPHPEGEFLERAAQLGDRLLLVGSVPAVNAYYHAMDVLVVPSTAYEAMPLVILEAAAARRPSIGSRLSGIPEAIADGETGELFTPGSAQELADAMVRAAGDPDRLRRLGEAARQRWEEEFAESALERHVLDLYEHAR